MNKISGKTNKTVVKIFINILVSAALLPHYSAFAADKATLAVTAASNPDAAKAVADALKEDREAAAKDKEAQLCKQATDKIDEATRKIGEACRKAGMSGSSNCVSKARSCADESGTDSFDTVGAFATVLGVPAGAAAGIGSACPQMNGRDYFAEKDKIQKEIKDTEKELAELNDDKANLQDDYNKEMQKIQETLTKAQEDYKKKESELDQEERERIAEFNNSQNQAKESMRKKGSEILNLRGQLTQLQRDKARSLNLMSESAGKRKCVSDLAKMKADYEKMYSSSAVSSSNHIAQAKKKKQEMIDFYNTCMNDFNQQRIALNEQTRQKQEDLDKQIRDAQSSLDEIQNSLTLANNQLDEMKQATVKKKTDALQSVIDLGTRSQQQMQAAYTKLQENLKTLAAKQASLQAALNRANQALMTLGPAPKSKSSEYTPGDASGEIDAQISVIERAKYGLPASCNDTVSKAVKEAQKTYGTK
ncbi:hypothetical protein [Bdellovibrio sp. BCCA]|uniref:hypothetical protein n=1 Tax=Bdellovibrio sp. BCCA TaxID=3136281 RepID=UPI0030F1DEB0